jgi:hypothetical protein
MAAAWMLAAAPAIVAPQAMAQDSASQGADSSTQSAGRSGVAQPSSAPITVTPYSDSDANIIPGSVRSSTPIVESIQPVKPSAAIPSAAPSATSVETVYGTYTPNAAPKLTTHRAATNSKVAATSGATTKANAAASFNPDAEIVTEETAGRDDRRITNDVPAKADEDAGIVTHVPSLPGEVPDGTLVKVKLHEDLSSLTTKAGTSFTAEVSEPVLRDGQVVVPTGSMLEGRVTWVRGGKRIGNSAAIHLEPRTITLPDGSQYMLHARVIDTDSWGDTKVDNEGTILRKDHSKATATTTALTTGGGMVAGAVLGGLPGAVVGAGVGAGVSTVVWARQDRQADLPKDLCIIFSLTEPMRITPISAQLARPAGTPNAN